MEKDIYKESLKLPAVCHMQKWLELWSVFWSFGWWRLCLLVLPSNEFVIQGTRLKV